MKLLPLTLLVLSALISGCQTSSTTTTAPSTNEGVETPKNKYDPVAAAEKRLSLGLKYIQAGNLQRAKMNLLKAEEHAPSSPDVLYGLGYYYQRVFEFDKADKYYRRALSKDSKNADYLNGYGAFLCTAKKDYKKAIKYFLRAVERPDYTEVGSSYENAGFCSLEGEDFPQAKLYFEKALTFNPRLSKSLFGMSQVEFDLANYNRAESYLLKYEGRAKPTSSSLLLGYKIGRRLNDKSSMESYGEKLVQLFPDSEDASLYRAMKR